MSTTISIIMPVYNAEHHLAKALKSALGQTLHGVEMICVDDGSTDGSYSILAHYEEIDSRVRVIRQKNCGAGSARNRGVLEASGEYVAFLDADDYYPSEDCLEILYDLAKTHGTNAAGGSLVFLHKGKPRPAKNNHEDYTFAKETVLHFVDFQQAYYYQRFIFSRSMLLESKIQFPDYRRFQDVVFFVNALLTAQTFVVTPKPVYVYRMSTKYASLSEAQINDMLQGYIDTLKIAGDNKLIDLFSFLSNRICGPNRIQKRVLESIRSGNRITQERYNEICDLVGYDFNALMTDEEQSSGKLRVTLQRWRKKMKKDAFK